MLRVCTSWAHSGLPLHFFMYAVWSKSWTYKYIRLVWGGSLYFSLRARGRHNPRARARRARGRVLAPGRVSTSLAQCGSSSVEATTSRALEKSTQCAKKKDTSKRAEGRLCRARSPRADTRTRITRSGDRGGPPRARAVRADEREAAHTVSLWTHTQADTPAQRERRLRRNARPK